MKKRQIVKSNIEFNNIINDGIRKKNKYFILCRVANNNEDKKFGIAVGKKIGKAYLRNKIKRRIRKIIDNNINLFKNGFNYIIICKKEVINLEFKELEKEVKYLLEKDE